jgi:hypothetical protein
MSGGTLRGKVYFPTQRSHANLLGTWTGKTKLYYRSTLVFPRVRRRYRRRNGKREHSTDDQKKAHVYPPSQFLSIVTLLRRIGRVVQLSKIQSGGQRESFA